MPRGRQQQGQRPKQREQKNTKTTSPAQHRAIINFLETVPGLITNTIRANTDRYWDELAERVNAAGVCKHDGGGWKKVVTDWKHNTKKKIAHNKQEMLSTGGGPNTLIALNDLEERLAVLAGLYAAVEGLQGTSSFGAPSSQETTNQMPTAPQSRQYALGTAYFDDDDCDEEGDDFENSVNNGGNGTQDQAQDDFALAEGGNDENVEDFDRTQNSGSSRLPPLQKDKRKQTLLLFSNIKLRTKKPTTKLFNPGYHPSNATSRMAFTIRSKLIKSWPLLRT